jgi:hypothetical protein
MPVSGPVRSSSWIPAAWSWADRVISSAALRASRLSSWTVRMTGWSGTASLMSRASLSAFSSSGRTLMRVLIFSEKIRLHCAASRAAVWLASSCWTVEQRAYPIRIGLAAFSARVRSRPGGRASTAGRGGGRRAPALPALRAARARGQSGRCGISPRSCRRGCGTGSRPVPGIWGSRGVPPRPRTGVNVQSRVHG